MRPLLIGEDNPRSSDPRAALWPEPVGCAGWRLATRILGLQPHDYLSRFYRANLCQGEWSLAEARAKAHELAHADFPTLVLLGARVAQAFHLDNLPFRDAVFTHRALRCWDPRCERTQRIIQLPHPSGRCYTWNDPAATAQAREVMREFLS